LARVRLTQRLQFEAFAAQCVTIGRMVERDVVFLAGREPFPGVRTTGGVNPSSNQTGRHPMHRSILRRNAAVLCAAAGVSLFAASPALAGTEHARAAGELVRYSAAIPVGAHARVDAVYNASGASIVVLHVWGLAPNTAYGSHAHVNACGTTGAAAGPHYQHVVDTHQPSTNPAYANPQNEIWLDFETDSEGNASATAKEDWQFSPDRRPGSVIIHAEQTHTGPDDSGTAGARLACLTVGF
jgi:Cu-Zn family superoxide dismutase